MLIYSCLHNLETCKNCKGLYSHFTLSLHFFFTVVSPIGQFLKTKNHIFVLPRQETILHRKVPTCEHLFLVQIFDFWDIFWDTFYEKPLTERSVRGFSGRRERDSNSRYPFGVHTLSRRASSATRASLQYVSGAFRSKPDCKGNHFFRKCKYRRVNFSTRGYKVRLWSMQPGYSSG